MCLAHKLPEHRLCLARGGAHLDQGRWNDGEGGEDGEIVGYANAWLEQLPAKLPFLTFARWLTLARESRYERELRRAGDVVCVAPCVFLPLPLDEMGRRWALTAGLRCSLSC